MAPHPKECGRKLLDALLEGNDEEASQWLKEKVDFDVECKGDNPIHLAARSGKLMIIQQMKSAGCNLQQKNMHGNTAMHYAAKGGFIDLLEYLKKEKCDLNVQNINGYSPLDMAVTCQTMNVIEALVDLGMNPNARNKDTGETPLFTALRAGAQEAMEGLLIKGANPDIKNKKGKKAEDEAAHQVIKESLRMYSALLLAMNAGQIKAIGKKISRKSFKQSMIIERVGVVLEKFDIPRHFPTGFYCRREKTENATIKLKKLEDESVHSDVFHIKIFEINRDCPALINLPIYKAPSEKEQLVLRFFDCALEDRPIDEPVIVDQKPFCPFEVTLIPETYYACVVYIRPRKEENAVSEEEAVITSEMDKDFSLEIPAGTFENGTVLSMQVFETHEEPDTADYDADSEGYTQEALSTETVVKPESEPQSNISAMDHEQKSSDPLDESSLLTPASQNLLTDVYQLNVSGEQPKKGIAVQIPMCKGMNPDDEIAIIATDEKNVHDEDNENAIEVLQETPKVVNCNLIFEVSHFSIYVATWKKKVENKEDRVLLQRQISSARQKRKPAAFFVVVRKDPDDKTGLKHVLIVECGLAAKCKDRRKHWLQQKYEQQNPEETGEIMMTPEDTFYVKVEGNVTFEDDNDAKERKIQFSQCRASFQPFRVNLKKGIYRDADAFGHVLICQKMENNIEEVARLRMKVTPPPRPKSAENPAKRKQKIMEEVRRLTESMAARRQPRPKTAVPSSNRNPYTPRNSVSDLLKNFKLK